VLQIAEVKYDRSGDTKESFEERFQEEYCKYERWLKYFDFDAVEFKDSKTIVKITLDKLANQKK
jgi:hypothetical protein